MLPTGLPEEFRRAEALLKRGECPSEDDLRYICQTDPIWLEYLGPSEKQQAIDCWEEYEEI